MTDPTYEIGHVVATASPSKGRRAIFDYGIEDKWRHLLVKRAGRLLKKRL
jgi:hypothetical protein